MVTRGSWTVQYCWQCTFMAAVGTCCSLMHSNPTTEGSYEKWGKVNNCLIFSVLTVAIPKAHWYILGSLKYTLLRQSVPRMPEHLDWYTVGCFCHLFPVRLTSVSNKDTSWDPLSLQKSRWVLPPCILMALGYAEHQCSPNHYAPRGLMCHAICSIQSSKLSCLFPLRGWR